MEIFIDSADVEVIEHLSSYGLVDGVTTNPSLIAKSGGNFKEVIKSICALVSGPVSAEVAATDYDAMIKEANILAKLAENVVIKVPLTWDGLKTCRELTNNGIKVNVTLCFSANQALLAAKAGAYFISPFIGRLDDIGQNGLELIYEIRDIYDNYPEIETKILAASIRTLEHVNFTAIAGADAITIPPKTFEEMIKHPMTDKGLATFVEDWKKTGQEII